LLSSEAPSFWEDPYEWALCCFTKNYLFFLPGKVWNPHKGRKKGFVSRLSLSASSSVNSFLFAHADAYPTKLIPFAALLTYPAELAYYDFPDLFFLKII